MGPWLLRGSSQQRERGGEAGWRLADRRGAALTGPWRGVPPGPGGMGHLQGAAATRCSSGSACLAVAALRTAAGAFAPPARVLQHPSAPPGPLPLSYPNRNEPPTRDAHSHAAELCPHGRTPSLPSFAAWTRFLGGQPARAAHQVGVQAVCVGFRPKGCWARQPASGTPPPLTAALKLATSLLFCRRRTLEVAIVGLPSLALLPAPASAAPRAAAAGGGGGPAGSPTPGVPAAALEEPAVGSAGGRPGGRSTQGSSLLGELRCNAPGLAVQRPDDGVLACSNCAHPNIGLPLRSGRHACRGSGAARPQRSVRGGRWVGQRGRLRCGQRSNFRPQLLACNLFCWPLQRNAAEQNQTRCPLGVFALHAVASPHYLCTAHSCAAPQAPRATAAAAAAATRRGSSGGRRHGDVCRSQRWGGRLRSS